MEGRNKLLCLSSQSEKSMSTDMNQNINYYKYTWKEVYFFTEASCPDSLSL